ncbi:MAG: proton-conducting transporter membrane subunit [Wenzhouxiangellaceae bacterium]
MRALAAFADWPHLLPALFLLPLAGAALLPALLRTRPAVAWASALAVALATTMLAVLALVRLLGDGDYGYAMAGWAPPLGIELRYDRLSAITLLTGALVSLALLFARREMTGAGRRQAVLYCSLVLILLGGMNGFVITADLFNLFVFMELLSLPAYALVAMSPARGAALAALKYLLPGAVSSLLVLFGIGVLHALTGSLNMADVAVRLTPGGASPATVLALVLISVGLLVKAALFPLHFWLPDAHSAAPGPVSALLSGLVVKMGVVGVVRMFDVFGPALGGAMQVFENLLLILGVLAILIGALAALVQHELKRMLAWSTVANIGYIFVGLGLAGSAAVSGGIAHVFYHGVTKAGLFLAAAALVERTGLRDIDDLRGLGHRMPLAATALSAGLIAAAGVPPTAGFVGKWQIALGALEAGRPELLVVVLGGALLALAYGMRVINALFFRSPVSDQVMTAGEAPASMLVPSVLLVALALAGGLSGARVIEFIQPFAESLGGR